MPNPTAASAARQETAEPLIFPCSYAQQRLWFIDQLEPGSSLYHIPLRVRLKGSLNKAALEESFREIIARHEILRTTFDSRDGQPVQIIHESADWKLQQVDLGRCETGRQNEEIQRAIQKEAETPFSLKQGPLIRAVLLQFGKDEHVLLVTLHHIVSDGWSAGVLFRELGQLYSAFSNSRPVFLPKLPIQYVDYAMWQREFLRGEVLQEQLGYWRRQFAGLVELELPPDTTALADSEHRGASERFTIGAELTAKLKEISRRENVTLFMTLLAAFQFLLSRYCGCSDVAIGTPVHGRKQSELEKLVGLFVNTLVMRAELSGDPTVIGLLDRISNMARAAYDNQDVPFEKVVEELRPERSLAHNPFFSVMFALQNVPTGAGKLESMVIEPISQEITLAKFDLFLALHEQGGLLEGGMQFRTSLLARATVQRLIGAYVRILEGMAAHPQERLSAFSLLSAEERQQVVIDWNRTATEYPAEKCIHEIFEEQVDLGPNAIAVSCHGQRFTYLELNRQANRLAHYLCSRGVGREDAVGLYMERGLEMVVGILAVLKAGGAYVPLDPGLPGPRLEHIIKDAGIRIVLTERQYLPSLPVSEAAQAVCLDELPPSLASQSGSNLKIKGSPGQLAYVLYTSGSSGTPKGVQVEQRSVVRLVKNTNYARFDAQEVVLHAAPVSFDASTMEIWGPLLNGGRLVIAPAGNPSLEEIGDLICKEQVSTLWLTSGLFHVMVEEQLSSLANLRQLLAGGDVLSIKQVLKAAQALSNGVVVNGYGPTENTTFTCCYAVREPEKLQGAVPIGTPIANTQVYVLDDLMQPCMIGAVGELYTGGAGLARGYLNCPELTAEKFVPDPFSVRPGERLYRTGDRVRRRADGNLEFLGRSDNQVKLRGFRIELGEIENALLQHPEVRAACAMVREDEPGHRRLVGYFVRSSGPSISGNGELKNYLHQRLPEYMVPGVLVELDALPLTQNGKVDRRKLPVPSPDLAAQEYSGPRNRVEEVLCRIWTGLLSVEKVGANDNFFDLGGDSILSIQLVSRARNAGVFFTPRQVFEYQTISRLAAVAETSQKENAEQGLITGPVELTPIQAAFFEWRLARPGHFNQSVMLDLAPAVDSNLLAKAVTALLHQHDALRMRYQEIDGVCEQWCESEVPSGVYEKRSLSWCTEEDWRSELNRDANHVQSSLDLKTGPLLRTIEYDLGTRGRRLLLVAHHLVIDGVSWRILLEDLERGYEQLSGGDEVQLGGKTTSYKTWASRLVEYAQSLEAIEEWQYWQEAAVAAAGSGKLPECREATGKNNTVALQGTVGAELNEDETRELLQKAQEAYHTNINDVLLTALWRVCSQWAGADKVLVELEGHGREEIVEGVDLSRTVGWFTSVYPVLLQGESKDHGPWDVGASLKKIKEQLRQVPKHGIGYGVIRYLAKNPQVRQLLASMPPAEIVFNYLGQFDQVLRSPKLFNWSQEAHGKGHAPENQRRHLLEINAIVSRGRLRVNWTYSQGLHDRERIEQLANGYVQCLREIIAHCKRPEVGGHTPSDFPLARLTQEELDLLIGRGAGIEDIYVLSPMQEGLLFQSLYEPDSTAYFNQLGWWLEGLDPQAFRRAWERVTARHTILRTGFAWEGIKHPVQIVRRQVELPWKEEDWRELGSEDQASEWQKFLAEDQRVGFDLREAPVFRLKLIRTAENAWYFSWSNHHILMDGWCRQILMGEVFKCYQAFRRGTEPELEKCAPYRDYIQWVQKQDTRDAESFWRREMEGFREPTRLWIQLPEAPEARADHAKTRYHAGAALTCKLEQLARQHRLTMNTIVQAAWGLLLARYSSQQDVVFGATVSGRPAALNAVESMAGLFINTLPVRVRIEEQQTIENWLKQVQQRQVEARQYEYISLAKIQSWSEVPRGRQLFDYLMVFGNYPVDAVLRDKKEIKVLGAQGIDRTHYLITLEVNLAAELALLCEYRRDLLEAPAAERILEHLGCVLEAIATDPTGKVSEISMLSPVERRQLLVEWNQTESEYPREQTFQQLFAKQAQLTPHAVAVALEDQTLTYAQLHRASNRLAWQLLQRGVGEEAVIGLLAHRSPDFLVAMLAIFKIGGAYLPLDPAMPQARLQEIVSESRAHLVLAARELAAQAEMLREKTVGRGTYILEELLQAGEQELAEIYGRPENLSYVIYTSGSTGKPKGAMLQQGGMVNHLYIKVQELRMTSRDVVAHTASQCFDISVWQFLSPLLAGGKVVIFPDEIVRDPARLMEGIAQAGVTIFETVPVMLRAIVDEGLERNRKMKGLKFAIVNGEACPVELARAWTGLHPEIPLINAYGPTECSDDVTHYWMNKAASLEQTRSLPIGRPLANTQLYVLDSNMQPAPAGVAGELYVGGAGVGRGYRGRPELTAERFLPNSLAGEQEEGTRLYRTGDLGRWRANGELEFLGRVDRQVKVRGYRIELEEIESALLKHEHVRQAAVVVSEDEQGSKRLVGYVVPKKEARAEAEEKFSAELRSFVAERLPEYMVPAILVTLDAMPLTHNGKIDTKNLPQPVAEADQDRYVQPGNAMEEMLCRILGEVLRLKRVGIHDNFFESGGDSILSIQVVSRARAAGVEITPKQIFENPTVAQLARVAGKGTRTEAEQGMVTGEAPLTPIQAAFFDWQLVHPEHYNQSFLLELSAETDSGLLQSAVQSVLEHHDVLRARFELGEKGWRQWMDEKPGSGWYERRDLSSYGEDEWPRALEQDASRVQAGLDLRKGPLFLAVEYALGAGRLRCLLLVAHHLVVDGVSWRIVLDDLEQAYTQLSGGAEARLGLKTTSYKQWSEKLRDYAQSGKTQHELAYWIEQGKKAAEAPRLPRDRDDAREEDNTVATQRSVTVSLDEDETRELLQQVPEAYHTQINDILLAALWRVCAEWTCSARLLVDLEGHGREEVLEDADTSRTVGWFTTIYPLVLEGGCETWHVPRALKNIKEQLRAVPGHGFVYGLLHYLNQDDLVKQQLASARRPELAFNYLGQFDQVFGQSKLFQPARTGRGSEVAPQSRRQYVMEVNSLVRQGRLSVNWSYSERLHSRETVEGLAQRYLDCLREITAHCMSEEAGGYTPSDFPLARLTQEQLDQIAGPHQEIEDIYPLSPMQQGLLFHALLEPKSKAYFYQVSCRMEGLDTQAFRSAWEQLIARHSIFRTAFVWEGLKDPVQIVRRKSNVPWHEEDWRGMRTEEQAEKWKAYLAESRAREFDFRQAPILRVAVMRIEDASYYVAWSTHHALMDGWSTPILSRELLLFYESYRNGRAARLPQPGSYRSYIAWLLQQDENKAEEFWRRELRDFSEPTHLWIEEQVNGVAGHGQAVAHIDKENTSRLLQLSKSLQVTINTILQGGWALVLSRYSGRQDVLFGAAVSGRTAPVEGIESMVGLFINTLPVRVPVRGNLHIDEYLKMLQLTQAEARQYENTSLGKIQQWSELPPGTPLFQYLMTFANYPLENLHRRERSNLNISQASAHDISHYALGLDVVQGEEISLWLKYRSDRFAQGDIERLLAGLEQALTQMAASPRRQLSDMEMLSHAEKRHIMAERNQTESQYPKCCVHEIFEEQVARTPDAPAVVCQSLQLTYAQLNRKANQLARSLVTNGVRRGDVIGLLAHRGPDFLVAMLAVFKAAAAYLPLDPESPLPRLQTIVAESNLRLVLCGTELESAAKTLAAQTGTKILTIEEALSPSGETGNLSLPAAHNDLAYVIYTSGSTGKPKGAMLQHGGMLNHLYAKVRDLSITAGDAVAQTASQCFDISVWQFLAPLLVGGRVAVIEDEAARAAWALRTRLAQEGVTIFEAVPSLLQAMLEDEKEAAAKLAKVRWVLATGEVCPPELCRAWFAAYPATPLVNAYGPTECSDDVTHHILREMPGPDLKKVPIGLPLANTRLYVLDENFRLVPDGVAGDLYVGGKGVGRGYLGRPDLTAARFVPDLFTTAGGERLYRTGDLARWRNGALEFMGRVDYQVKVRGHRIELGEIEAALLEHPAVLHAAVVARNDRRGDKFLAAYFTLKAEGQAEASSLKEWLEARLPGYMVPAHVVPLDAMPLNANGKIDRKLLAEREVKQESGVESPSAPRNETEEILSGIWAAILNVEQVGIHDNFFELGGHSLTATRVVSQVRRVLKTELTLREFFDGPTVAEQAASILNARRKSSGLMHGPSPRGDRQGDLPLSYAQQRLWFMHQMDPESGIYNIPLQVRLRGPLDAAALAKGLNAIVRRHEILRTRFAYTGQQPVQTVFSAHEVPLEILDLTAAAPAEREERTQEAARLEYQKTFDLQHGPLLRARLLRVGAEEHVLLLTVHHIVSDGWSTEIMVKELAQLYKAFAAGEPSSLPELPIQYADYAIWQRERLRGEALDLQLQYWEQQLAGLEDLDLPADHGRSNGARNHTATERFRFSPQLSSQLKALARREGATMFMTLLTGFQLLLSRYSGQQKVAAGTPIAGRSAGELEELIGVFINLLVLKADVTGDPSLLEMVSRVRETTLDAYAHQNVPFEMVVERLQPERSPGRHPLFQIMFLFQNLQHSEVNISGLSMSPLDLDAGGPSEFDLILSFQNDDEELTAALRYRADLYDAATIRRWSGQLERVFLQMTSVPETKVSSLSLLGPAERDQILLEWNATSSEFPRHQCLHELFEDQAARSGDAIALEFRGEKITYRALDRAAEDLAHRLREIGVGPEVRAGIYMERGIPLITALLGVLKAGGAYVPLDPGYPAERLNYMLQDSGALVLLTHSGLQIESLEFSGRVIVVDNTEAGAPVHLPAKTWQRSMPENLAYVIYTSGSTGKPKGVQICHGALVNFMTAMRRRIEIQAEDVVLAQTTLSFDIAGLELFLPLVCGARVRILEREAAMDGDRLQAELKNQITIMQATPTGWQVLLESGWSGTLGLKMLCGGEALTPELARRLAGKGSLLWNMYGPTETTIWSLMERMEAEQDRVWIGRPIGNTQVYVVDERMQPAPIGVAGELWLGGAGVARGYLNLPGLTAEKFVPSPFAQGPGERLYRTGDRARFGPDGRLEFLGRIDDQVKIRGFRIELGEIEARLVEHPEVREAVVVARRDGPGEQRLIGYVVPQAVDGFDAADGISTKTTFSLFYFGADTSAKQNKYELYLRSARFADMNQFEAIWTPERHFHNVGQLYPNPATLSAALSTMTTNVKLRAGSVVLPLHDPIRVAEEWAIVDNLSNGRAGIAAASGWHPRDFSFFPQNFARRRQVMMESIQQLKKLWRGESITRTDGNGKESSVRIFPEPIQAELPLWITAAGSPDTFIQAGKLGANLLTHLLGQTIPELAKQIAQYRAARAEAGHDPQTGRVTLMIHTFVGEDLGETLNQAKAPFMDYMREHLGLMASWAKSLDINVDDLLKGDDKEKLAEFAFERYSRTASLIGTPQSCLSITNQLQEIGVDEIACLIDWMDTEKALNGLPQLKRLYDLSRVSLNRAALRSHLSSHLPKYMVPDAFVILDALPLTPNRKIDRKALPKPEAAVEETQYAPPRNAVEEVLCGLWAHVLGFRRRIGIFENFFELGGDSLLAVQAIMRAREAGFDLALSDMFARQTVAELAQVEDVPRSVEGALGSMLVKLRSKGDKPPLFCLHPMGGGMDFLFPLSRNLANDRPLYGIRSGGFDHPESYHPELEEIVNEYIDHIKSVQPQGPYFLAGYSLGGTIAFAMALELAARGDHVAFLGQIDTDILPPLDEDATEIHELQMFAKAYSDLRPSEEELRKAPQGRRLEYLLGRLKLQTPAFEYAQVARIAPVWQANRRAAWNFLSKVFARPEAYRYSGRITLFRAIERPMMLGGEPDPLDGNWQAFSVQPVEVRHVPGKHTTCILEPHARHLAGELMLAMEDFQSKF